MISRTTAKTARNQIFALAESKGCSTVEQYMEVLDEFGAEFLKTQLRDWFSTSARFNLERKEREAEADRWLEQNT